MHYATEQALQYDSEVIYIESGNHSQMGDCVHQDKDLDATISIEEQHSTITTSINEFIK